MDDAISGNGMFVAIGDKQASYGSFKIIVPDDGWKDTFFRLIASAQLIVVLPGTSASTIWEISQILSSSKYLEKSVFIMPRRTQEVSRGTETRYEIIGPHWWRLQQQSWGRSYRVTTARAVIFVWAATGASVVALISKRLRRLSRHLARRANANDLDIAEIWKAAL